jgi:methanogenic corrinoid protein MtbC1
MKHVMLVFSFVMFAFAGIAQINKDDLQILQATFGKEKAELVKAYMAIPPETDAAFWSLYDKFEEERRTIGRSKAALIEEYAKAYESLDDKKSVELTNKKLKINEDYIKLQRKYLDSFTKLIGGRRAAKFFQLEDYLENIIRLAIQESIPFIDELDKTKLPEATKQ